MGIFWKIFVNDAGTDGDTPLVKLSWGWTAGMTPEEIGELDEDCPQGEGSIITTKELIRELRDDLNKILDS